MTSPRIFVDNFSENGPPQKVVFSLEIDKVPLTSSLPQSPKIDNASFLFSLSEAMFVDVLFVKSSLIKLEF